MPAFEFGQGQLFRSFSLRQPLLRFLFAQGPVRSPDELLLSVMDAQSVADRLLATHHMLCQA
jgi:hypothetical protein